MELVSGLFQGIGEGLGVGDLLLELALLGGLVFLRQLESEGGLVGEGPGSGEVELEGAEDRGGGEEETWALSSEM